MSEGSLFVICAPSGTGKTSLVRALTAQDSNLEVSISYTTREQRKGEQNGIDYHFINQMEFDTMKANNSFIEFATVYGYNYGTAKNELEAKLQQGIDIILEIDLQGSKQVSDIMPAAVVIGIVPPSIETLEKRLILRAKDSAEVIKKRMSRAQLEIAQQMKQQVDYIVINDNFDDATKNLQIIVAASRMRTIVNMSTYKKYCIGGK